MNPVWITPRASWRCREAEGETERVGSPFHRKLWFCECRLDYGRASIRCLISGISARQPRILASSSFERVSGMKEREMKLFGCRWSFWNFAANLAGSSSGVLFNKLGTETEGDTAYISGSWQLISATSLIRIFFNEPTIKTGGRFDFCRQTILLGISRLICDLS